MQWDVEPVAAQMSQMASDLTARINALDPESESPVFSDFSFVITVGDWELTNGLYTARVNNTVLLTATAGIQVFYDSSIRTALVGDIYEDKHTGYIDFYTAQIPTGSISGIVRVIDSTGGNVQVSRGGTGASTPKKARENLNAPIRDIPLNFGTISSLPQTLYDADLTANMVAFDASFSNPAAVPDGIDVTFANGSVTITGTIVSGEETTIKFWAHEERSAVEGTETPAEQQRVTDFVQVQAQTLTAAQKEQVRDNIGAADADDLETLSRNLPKKINFQVIKSGTLTANSITSISVTFNDSYDSVPVVWPWIDSYTSYPERILSIVGVNSITKTGCSVLIYNPHTSNVDISANRTLELFIVEY